MAKTKVKSRTGWSDATEKKLVLRLGIEQTAYSLLIVNGKVTPLISIRGPWEVWHIVGLDQEFAAITKLDPSGKKLGLTLWGGDMHSTWTLDFSRGLAISYKEEYHGP